jgi:hypothetical protein
MRIFLNSRAIIAFCLLTVVLLSLKTGKEITNPFSNLKYDKVIAYDYNGEWENQIINKNGKLDPTVTRESVLTQSQIIFINTVINDTNTYGGGMAGCFDPHFGIVYYQNDSVVAHISICLECNYLESSFKIPAVHAHDIEVQEDSLILPRSGFSKEGRKKINKLVKDLGFSHTIKKGSAFDK